MESGSGSGTNAWKLALANEGIEAMVDVTQEDKTFMKLWNQFVCSQNLNGDVIVAKTLEKFVLIHGFDVVAQNLKPSFLIHLNIMLNEELISPRVALNITEGIEKMQKVWHRYSTCCSSVTQPVDTQNSESSDVHEMENPAETSENIINYASGHEDDKEIEVTCALVNQVSNNAENNEPTTDVLMETHMCDALTSQVSGSENSENLDK